MTEPLALWPQLAGDPRLDPARADGPAAAGGAPERRQVIVDVVGVRGAPAPDARLTTQALFGELADVHHQEDGWAFVQLAADGYVGYAPAEAFGRPGPPADAKIAVARTLALTAPSATAPVRRRLGAGAPIAVVAREERFVEAAGAGWIPAAHVRPLAHLEIDWVALAEQFRGVPYVWGGRDGSGLDCSGLVQVALAAAGVAAPRDTDMQERVLGAPVADGASGEGLRRGDLVFWRGHVGIMTDGHELLHANAHHMAVATEPLAEAVARIAAHVGPVTSVRRPPVPR